MKILIAIPCFNESATLEAVIQSIRKEFSYEHNADILLIDDGSTDDSLNIAKKTGIYVLANPDNSGLGFTFYRAAQYALEHNYDVLLTTDADGQFDPKDLAKIIKPIAQNEADFVTGSRFLGDAETSTVPQIKKIGNLFFAKLISLITGQKHSDVSCGLRAYSKRSLALMSFRSRFTYTHTSIIQLSSYGVVIVEKPISVKYFQNRDSAISGNLTKYAIKTLPVIFKELIISYPDKSIGLLFWLCLISVITLKLVFFPSKDYSLLPSTYVSVIFLAFLLGSWLTAINLRKTKIQLVNKIL